jgi:tetratricopeptide (TPR) repeat protein
MNCREVEEQGVLECYLLGRLPDSQRDEFERHCFECDSCSSLLQVELTVQEHLKLLQPILPPAKKASIRRTWYWMPAFAVLTLVLVAGIWWRARQQQPVHQEASATLGTQPTSSGETQQPPLVGPSLEELARVQPPPYSVTVLRGAEDVAEFKFENAMQHYVNGGYASAIPGLRTAVKNSPRTARFSFYLGACYLMTGQTSSAIASFRKTISQKEQPYSNQSHYYLAKAYLQSKDVASAKKELQMTVDLGGGMADEAGEVLHQLNR